MFCTNCGKEIVEGAAFCSNCGQKVVVPQKPAYEVPPVVAEPVVAPVAPVTEEAPVVPAYEVAPVAVEPVVAEAPVVPAYEVAPVVAEPVVEEAPVVPAYEVAPVVAEPVVEEAPVVPAYEVAPVAPVVVEAPVVPAYAVAEEETPKAVEPVYVPSVAPVQQNEEVKNNGKVGFGTAISLLFKNIVNFTGKASRSEFWFGYLFIGLVTLTLACMGNPYIVYLLSLGTALPCLSLSVRRIRDTGKNWNYIFMGLIPIVGAILLIITFCKDTDSEKEQ